MRCTIIGLLGPWGTFVNRHISVTQILLVSTFLVPAPQAASQEKATPLAPIVVQSPGKDDDTASKVLAKSTPSATKTATPVIETPQSVTTVTRRQIDEQNPQTVSEALRYTAGVLSDRDSNSRYDSLFIRGFGAFGTATSYVNYLDGLKLQRGQAFATPSIDPFFLDHIDVLKGPSALLYGQVSPGGLVNQVSRAPSDVQANEIRIEGGTDGRIQTGLYSTGPITTDGTWQYGLATVGRSSGTRYDDVDEKRFGIAPALKWQPDATTSLTFSGYYQRDPEGGYFNSIYPKFLAPAGLAGYLGPKLDVGDPSYDSFEREQYGAGYQFEHSFDNQVTVRSNFRYSGVNSELHSLQMNGPMSAAGIIPRWAVESIEDAKGFSFDNQAEFKVDTGAVNHTLLAGVDIQRTDSSWQYLLGGATPLDVTNPVYGQPVGPFVKAIDTDLSLRQTGIYLQDQIELGGLRGVFGVRHDWADQDTDNLLAGTSSDQSDSATSFRAGLLYLFDNGIAPFASYSTSFEPSTSTGAGGAAFKPTDAQQYEVGIKYQPTGFDALFTVSAFDIRQQNVVSYDAASGFNVQQGEIHSRGVEFEARGNVTSNIELIGAFSLLDTTVSKSFDTSLIGNRPQAVPRYFGSLWANYTVDSGSLEGLGIGGGVRFVGSSYSDDANTVKADGYTLLDAALRYDFGAKNLKLKGLQATLNVTNLLDKEYYSSCSSEYYCQYGNGRTLLAGLKYKW
ncbi:MULTISPECIES: TonB-dependent siderophore receptor [unclassified Rhizobium]|uniref:TonB-dependent siderophore receptor n=1 Tax=unclassified Rhizobium TaxID=2613769 RepID=UPI001ADD3637|nr:MULTISPECIES: TonB-dependent siderophore receptor [unclassified Rhizobium]MBO9101938.1 TonB-dependent siderophore receptor [Rhizobium sp. L58/93]MBO9172109.1 TonB-dependent siderophore receptor [Rhizobium sp. L245/93]QXZ88324.1 TonB-dependent siderophore receptor [Rhizobium sp. K1/93]QXZ94295.1 TonB-dependent siderophore receptor [Rhizobium sp. K15/93]QYA05616.1 TonB-dependent siderophore receptor [Rhizobium sp. B21/90]